MALNIIFLLLWCQSVHGNYGINWTIEDFSDGSGTGAPIDGGFTEWSNFTACSASCDGGTQMRTRTCTNPIPQNGGEDCTGATSQKRPCNDQVCPVDGNWGSWTLYNACSVSCGGGMQARIRVCNNPKPQGSGKVCVGDNMETRRCNDEKCDVDGEWSKWSEYDKCTKTCDGGIQKRYRSCNNPAPKGKGKDCLGNDTQIRNCSSNICPVDGQWGDWSEYETCTKTCGGGMQKRYRKCDNPVPKGTGKYCQGNDTQFKHCNDGVCLVDGQWGGWSEYDTCTKTCGSGLQTRYRNCDNPIPKGKGKYCVGVNAQSRICNSDDCPVDGQWGDWSEYDTCTKTCGSGLQTRYRNCDNPTPKGKGKYCVGVNVQSRICNSDDCPVDGEWGDWSKYDKCSQTCDEGLQKRYRKCNNPAPKGKGKYCQGNDTQIKFCKENICSVDGQWGAWSEYGKCSKTCGGGMQTRLRNCTNPTPKGKGKYCSGNDAQVSACNTYACPVPQLLSQGKKSSQSSTYFNMNYLYGSHKAFDGWLCTSSTKFFLQSTQSEKSPWLQVDLGNSQNIISVKIYNRLGVYGKKLNNAKILVSNDAGFKNSVELCAAFKAMARNVIDFKCKANIQGRFVRLVNSNNFLHVCEMQVFGYQSIAPESIDGQWGSWSEYDECSKTCGGGSHTRLRNCVNPAPKGKGKYCSGHDAQVSACNTDACPESNAPESVTTCKWKRKLLRCANNKTIHINTACWYQNAITGRCDKYSRGSCKDAHVLRELIKKCNGKKSCDLWDKNTALDLTFKITYWCN